MKLAIVGSRTIKSFDLKNYVTNDCNEIVSGGAKGIDKIAQMYAKENNLKVTVFLPDYKRYLKGAPFKRNQQIAEYADKCLAIWDGKSKGTINTVELFKKFNKPVRVITVE
jgi:predicted Rossmann fold nucleotide-binding protein DprA/Smf involved in DNA uptake